MSLSSYLSYLILVLALVYTPGPMTMFLMASGMRSQMKYVYPVLLGANHAYLLAIIIFSIGLAQLLQQHIFIFEFFQLLGVAYLVYLAVMQWHKAALRVVVENDAPREVKKISLYTNGAAVALSNPKTILLFTIIFPQFAKPGNGYYSQIAILGTTFLILQFSSGCCYAFLGVRMKNFIANPRYQMFINKISALILIAVAIFLSIKI